jgi:hypothetical protein
MGKTPSEPQATSANSASPRPSAAQLREARLKAALKANMARRKGQAAARRTAEASVNEQGD